MERWGLGCAQNALAPGLSQTPKSNAPALPGAAAILPSRSVGGNISSAVPAPQDAAAGQSWLRSRASEPIPRCQLVQDGHPRSEEQLPLRSQIDLAADRLWEADGARQHLSCCKRKGSSAFVFGGVHGGVRLG
jgi:hypothetical protein